MTHQTPRAARTKTSPQPVQNFISCDPSPKDARHRGSVIIIDDSPERNVAGPSNTTTRVSEQSFSSRGTDAEQISPTTSSDKASSEATAANNIQCEIIAFPSPPYKLRQKKGKMICYCVVISFHCNVNIIYLPYLVSHSPR